MIALDATYSLGRNLSGIGVYSREILFGLARKHPEEQFLFYYRPNRYVPSFRETLPDNVTRRILHGAPAAPIFHALNQRVDEPAQHTVSTFHDLFVLTGDYSTEEFRARFTQQARHAAERSDLIIAVSQFTAKQIQALLAVDTSRIRVIHHGVHIPPPSKVPRENLVLSVGAIQKRKNIAGLVRAFETLPAEWRLVLAGAPDGYGAAEELEAVENSPRQEDIEVVGYVPQEKLEELYARARIFAFPSLDEGFGLPVLEAMARGVPVVSSRRSAIPEVAGDAALLIDPFEPRELAHALGRLATEDALREDLIHKGRARALEFSWEAAIDKTWKVYDEFR